MSDDATTSEPPDRADESETMAEAFTYNGGRVDPGESANIRYGISETYLGDPVRIPVTVINGEHPGPTVFLSRRRPTGTNSTGSRSFARLPTTGITLCSTGRWSACR